MAPPDLGTRLRAAGYRLTPQRQLILDAVRRLDHGTPDAIAREVRRSAPGVNITTVYRGLELLERLGVVTRAPAGRGAPVYHESGDAHPHLVCRRCRRVVDAPADLARELVRRAAAECGFIVEPHHVTVLGTCDACALGTQAEAPDTVEP